MRASLNGKHVSGAERIVRQEEIEATVSELIKRPKEYDDLRITVEELKHVNVEDFELPVFSYEFDSTEKAREFALKLLVGIGIPEEVARKGLYLLIRGPSPEGGVMRGAVILDIQTGRRLEPDPRRGVRTVRFDWENREKIKRLLLERGYTERTLDALALAYKNILCGVTAELCWSDDPDYLTGYVASRKTGYVRIKPLKEKGNPVGGRIYFVNGFYLNEVIECLEKKAFIFRVSENFF